MSATIRFPDGSIFTYNSAVRPKSWPGGQIDLLDAEQKIVAKISPGIACIVEFEPPCCISTSLERKPSLEWKLSYALALLSAATHLLEELSKDLL